jgi:hypothetical protein
MQMYVRAILLFHSSAGQTKKGEDHDYSCCEWTHMLILTTKTNPFIVILLLIFSSQLSFNEVFLWIVYIHFTIALTLYRWLFFVKHTHRRFVFLGCWCRTIEKSRRCWVLIMDKKLWNSEIFTKSREKIKKSFAPWTTAVLLNLLSNTPSKNVDTKALLN